MALGWSGHGAACFVVLAAGLVSYHVHTCSHLFSWFLRVVWSPKCMERRACARERAHESCQRRTHAPRPEASERAEWRRVATCSTAYTTLLPTTQHSTRSTLRHSTCSTLPAEEDWFARLASAIASRSRTIVSRAELAGSTPVGIRQWVFVSGGSSVVFC